MKHTFKLLPLMTGGVMLACAAGTLGGCKTNKEHVYVQPRVTVTGGTVEGEYVTNGTDSFSREYDSVLSFKGIPYAAPPIGKNRWRAPQDVEPWEGIRECKQFGANPYQTPIGNPPAGFEYEPQNIYGYDEDCLTLNIWTNGKELDHTMPVLFYIYGGSFVSGSNSVEIYNGEYLASQEVVVVTVNYRLNIFGWFSAEELAQSDSENSTGNYGLMDCIKALEWCKANIRQFGGDPERITLYGASAGGGLINALITSPKSQGMFKRAYSMSYPQDALNFDYLPIARVERCRLGSQLIQDAGGLDKLYSMSSQELYNFYTAESAKNLVFIGPCRDGVYVDKTFIDGLREGRGKDVDVIFGLCHDPANPSERDDTAFSLFFGIPEKYDKGDVMTIAVNSYVKARIAGGAKNTRMMQFRHETPGPERMGAFHGSDQSYSFYYFSNERKKYWKDQDYEMGEIMSAYMINFVKTGNPNGKLPKGKNLTKWDVSTGNYRFLAMNNECSMVDLPTKKIGNILAMFRQKGYDSM